MTSDVISSQPIACPSDPSRSRSRVFTDLTGRKCVLSELTSTVFQSLPCRPGLVVSSGVWWTVKLPASITLRTRILTSSPVNQSRVLPTSHEAGHVVSPTRSRSKSRDSPNRKVGNGRKIRPGHEADRRLQSANHVLPPTSKLVM